MNNIYLIENKELKEGNNKLYEHLFTSYYIPLSYYACSLLRDMDEAEDIVQKVFYKLWDHRKNIEIKTSIKSYLYRAVHNECLNRIQQIKVREKHNQQYLYSTTLDENNTSSLVINNELSQKASEAIESLPPKCKKVFKMSRVQRLSYSEIAQELNLSVNTVENHIAKALKLLRTSLKDFLPFILFFLKFEQ